MHLKLTVLGLLLLGFDYLATFILFVNIIITVYGKKIFAAFLDNFSEKYNEVSDAMKKELFEELNNMESKDEKVRFLKNTNQYLCIFLSQIHILEIGGGSGTNFRFWTRPAVVEVVEPNTNFVQYFDNNRAKYPQLDIREMKQVSRAEM